MPGDLLADFGLLSSLLLLLFTASGDGIVSCSFLSFLELLLLLDDDDDFDP